MIVKFRNPDDEIFEIHKNLGNCFQFYPLYIDKRKNFYGLLFVPEESEMDIARLFSSNFFEILDFSGRNILFFKTKYVFQFYPGEYGDMMPFILKDGFSYFFTTKKENLDVHSPVEHLSELDFECSSFHERFANNLSLLGMLASSATYLDRGEKESLVLAISFGYPVSDLIDFRRKKIMRYRDKIFRKWKGILGLYLGDVEKNFITALHRSTEKLVQNNKELFERVSFCNLGENISFTAESLLKFMEIIPTKEKYHLDKNIPKLLINQLMIESVCTINKQRRDDLKENILSFLKNYPIRSWLISEWRDKNFPPPFRLYRYAFLWDFPSEGLVMSEFTDHVEELKALILTALRKTDEDSWSRSSRKRQEFWIRSIDLTLTLPTIFSDTAVEVIRENFSFFLDRNENDRLIEKKIVNEKFCVLTFKLKYPMFQDYRISKRKLGYFYEIQANDKFTRQGIEAARKHSFSKSMALLERGSHGIAGDILVWKSKLAKGVEKDRYLRRAGIHYQHAGLPLRSKRTEQFAGRKKFLRSLMDFQSDLRSDLEYIKKKAAVSIGRLEKPLYLPHLDPAQLMIVQQINYDWRIAVEFYLIGKSMTKDIIADGLGHYEEDSEKKKLASMYLTYSSLGAKDYVCLVEDLGVFYAQLLGEIQRKFGDLTAEWLGFNF